MDTGAVQPYDYLVIVDFEATCDEGPTPKVTRENQEIIEFPWAVCNLHTHQIVDQKQLYVKPLWSAELTPFCTKLTGITSDMLASSGTLQDAVQQFDNYVYTNFIQNNKSFCIITDGPWDLKQCLRREATAKGIKLAAHYSRFFDLRSEFSSCYAEAPRIMGLRTMVEFLGLSMEGRHHSGIDDCRTIANIVARMLKDGHRFEAPEFIPDTYNPDNDDTFKDYNLSRAPGWDEAQGAKFVENYAEGTMGETSASTELSTVVRLRGLPWQATEADIQEFFQGLELAPGGVHVTLNFQGRPTGEAFVTFATPGDAEQALERHKRNIGHRYIEVFKSSLVELEGATTVNDGRGLAFTGGAGLPQGEVMFQGVVRMRGLPFSATSDDIAGFFEGLSIAPNGIHLMVSPDGRSSGEAYVEFNSEEDAKQALQRHRERMGTRYIELFRSSKGELYHVLQQRYNAGFGMGTGYGGFPYGGGLQRAQVAQVAQVAQLAAVGMTPGGYGMGDNTIVRLRGLPFSATQLDIVEFFRGLRIVPDGIHIVYNAQNRPTGECYVEFAAPEDAQVAMGKHREVMGSRYVEVFRTTRNELMMAVGAGGFPMAPGMDPNMLLLMQQQQQMQQYGMEQAALMNMGWGDATAHGYWAGAGMGRGVPMPAAAVPPVQPPTGFGGGATVKLRGLPYRSSVQDILDFFRDYDVMRDSVTFGQDRDGRASGEGWVTFTSPEEAQRAARERNREHMGNRYIELFIQ